MRRVQVSALAATVGLVFAAPTSADAVPPAHSCRKALSYEISLRTTLRCSYANLLVEDVAQQVASRWPVKVFYLWDHGTDTLGYPREFRYTCHASEGQQPGPGGDVTEIQRFHCAKTDGEDFNLVTEID